MLCLLTVGVTKLRIHLAQKPLPIVFNNLFSCVHEQVSVANSEYTETSEGDFDDDYDDYDIVST